MRKLQVVHNAAARLLSGVRKYHHISPTLAALHWLPIRFRVDFKVLMLTYKALKSLGVNTVFGGTPTPTEIYPYHPI